MAEQIGIRPNRRLLDLGCGWGPLLDFARRRGAEGVGLTLSKAQAAACRRHGLDVRIQDVRAIERSDLGEFDAIASLGAFEHFCSFDDYRAGRQEQIYAELFERVAALLPPSGRLYLQTMVFGANMIDPERADLEAPRDSDEWYLALMLAQFPGSFLPFGANQIVQAAAPHLTLISEQSGRLDYIETIRQWRLRFAQPSLRKTMLKLRLVPRYLTSPKFRLAFTSGVSANTVCFQRELLDHHRMVFERPG